MNMPAREITLLQSQTFIHSLCDRALINLYRRMNENCKRKWRNDLKGKTSYKTSRNDNMSCIY